MNSKVGNNYFVHQFGNDRVVALTTHGTISLRQDEGSPKFLNDYDADNAQVRGGFGYLNSGKTVLVSSRYENIHTMAEDGEAQQEFSHTLGVGYYRKEAFKNGAILDEVLTTPFGDDPVVFIQTTVSNQNIQSDVTDLFYTMYFGERMLQLSDGTNHSAAAYGARVQSKISTYSSPSDSHIKAQGLLALHTPPPSDFKQQTFAGERPPPTLNDPQPRPTFLVSLGGDVTGWASSGKGFFGDPVNYTIPPMLEQGELDNSTSDTGPDAMLCVSVNIPSLSSGSNHTLYFLYGYLPNANGLDLDNSTRELNDLLQRYTDGQSKYGSPEHVWGMSSTSWRQEALFNVSMPTVPWMSREVAWHSFALRSMLTFDSYFNEHILNQAGQYLYNNGRGFQGAARDPLCHGLPLTYGTGHRYYAEILRYTLKELRFCPTGQTCTFTSHGPACVSSSVEQIDSGESMSSNPYPHYACGIPWAVWANGEDYSTMWPSDLEQWLLMGLSEYVLATREFGLLDENVMTQDGHTITVRQGAWHAYERFRDVIGFGAHGLCRLLLSDHNDGFLHNVGISGTNATTAELDGESVMNTAMATFVLDKYAKMLSADTGSSAENVSDVTSMRQKLLDALQKFAFVEDKGWYARAYLGNDQLGWVGRDDKALWLEPNSYALLGGVTEMYNTSDQLVKIIDQNNRHPSPTGALFTTDPRCNGAYQGVWYVGNWPLTLALGHLGYADMALDEWQKNSLAMHTETYPDDWPGTCSGPDFYQSIEMSTPGRAASIFNAWSHTYPVATLPGLVGLSWDSNGFSVRPSLSVANYSISSSLFGFSKMSPMSGKMTYSGWYNPPGTNAMRSSEDLVIDYLFTADVKKLFTKAIVNGKVVPLTTAPSGALRLSVTRAAGEIVNWTLE